ncbi:methyl-accepting chemotaxis protein [Konateibacter massiliensis]|uniref:methyl-accepting chemotaxis protein n=1 Tax=Konateibacter massiliensis TaxID=2002841 RepID=UPI000C1469AD|nr:methyl-accepting chemotaxis protein [Konateibacter massiliensis]
MKVKAKRKKSGLLLKTVVINLIILIVLISGIVTLLYRSSANRITSEIEKQIQLKLQAAQSEIESIRSNHEVQLKILSKSADTMDVLVGGSTDRFAALASSVVDNNNGFLENILLIDKTGKVIFDTNNNSLVGTDLSDRSYVAESLKGNTARSEMLTSKSTGNNVEVVSVPVEKNGTVAGVLAISMNVQYVNEILSAVKVGENGYAYLIDENGVFLYHPDSKYIQTNIADIGVPELTAVLPDMTAGNTGVLSYTFNGVEKLNVYAPIGGWSLSVNAVKSEYLADVKVMLMEAIAIGVFMTIIATLATGFNSYLMIKRIKRVQGIMEVVTGGDLTVHMEEKELEKCWEIRECNEPDCPAYKSENLKCWEMTGTLCDGVVQGNAASKMTNCKKCEVYVATEGDELEQVSRSLSTMIRNIRNLIYHISEISASLSSSSEELSSSSEETTSTAESISNRMFDMSTSAQEQTEYVETINTMTHDMNTKLSNSVGRINDMSKEAGVVSTKAKVGEEKIGSAINGMEQIKHQTEKIEDVMGELIRQSAEIGTINNMITEIAEETNLLSLNASIEAARAGESGRGFGVVADEIGKLAAQSQESAKGISVLIDRITESIHAANKLMHSETEFVSVGIQTVQESKAAFEEISKTVHELVSGMDEVVDHVETVKDSSAAVTQAVEKMSVIIEESGASVEEITAATEEQANVSEEISKSATDLANMAEELIGAVSAFKV